MSSHPESTTFIAPGRAIIVAAAMVIVIAGMKAASSLIVPFLLAVFVSVVCASPLAWLRRHKVPNWLALLIVIVGIAVLGSLVLAVIGGSINDFTKNLPYYQTRLNSQSSALRAWLQERSIGRPADVLSEYVDMGAVMGMVGSTLSSLGLVLTNSLMLVLTVIFILAEASQLRTRLQQAYGGASRKARQIDIIMRKVQRYMALKTVTSIATGVVVALWLTVLDVDFPVLWGMLAFLLNYVPNIGSIIAAIPAVLLALIQLGPLTALLAAGGYLVVNNVVGNVLEPKLLGRGLGLSTLVVFVSLVFWGWVLGPAGMFLSVPLTMTVLIGLDSHPATKAWAVMLGSGGSAAGE
ncbi:MAG: AI-2E family transporter [bacterium]